MWENLTTWLQSRLKNPNWVQRGGWWRHKVRRSKSTERLEEFVEPRQSCLQWLTATRFCIQDSWKTKYKTHVFFYVLCCYASRRFHFMLSSISVSVSVLLQLFCKTTALFCYVSKLRRHNSTKATGKPSSKGFRSCCVSVHRDSQEPLVALLGTKKLNLNWTLRFKRCCQSHVLKHLNCNTMTRQGEKSPFCFHFWIRLTCPDKSEVFVMSFVVTILFPGRLF